MFKKIMAALCISGLLAATAPAYAGSSEKSIEESAVVFDAVLARPLGLVSIVIGTGVFIISLPFTLPTWSVGKAADKLIAEPVKFTFARPIGEMRE